MSGYESKRAAAQDKLAQPAQEPNWTCNGCGAQEFTAALSEADLDYLACSNCGGDEFHKEALAQPAQEPVAWMHPVNKACVTTDPTAYARGIPLYATPPQRPKALFPTMLRKMWSGSEVQAWLDENVNKENT